VGTLLSPARGLFFYFPVAFVALMISARRPVLASDDLAKASLAAFGGIVILISSYLHWDGGHSVGARYFTEVEPLLLVLFGLAWQALHYRARRRLAVLCFGLLLPYSIFVQSVGTYSTRPMAWNQEREKEGAAVIWDFKDNPIAHAFRR
jgi:hypothetical protein